MQTFYYVEDQACLFDLDSWSGKTSPEPFPAENPKGKISVSSSRRSSELRTLPYMFLDLTPGHGDLLGKSYWEMIYPSPGESLTLNTGPAPLNAVDVYTLSQILEDSVLPKYYLTKLACRGILRRAKERGKPLPWRLEKALLIQAGLIVPTDKYVVYGDAWHINQRNEGIDLHGVSGALMHTQNMQMQTFVTQPGPKRLSAAFSGGAGPSAGGIGYTEELSPTLKAADGGNMVPSVLCLNDQGGSVMEWSEDVSGTLRAQEHGHQPLVYENHGIDSRYTGPHKVAPTMSARYGTGGNNVPLVEQEPEDFAVFSRQRVDVFAENDVASTESARQHKDATDLVIQDTMGALTSSDWRGLNNQYVSQDKCVVEDWYLIRRLTPLECERLQGFPDGWTDIPGASDSARYKALGNSVAIPCVEYVISGIALALKCA